MSHPYYESILLIERLHRQFLEVVKVHLDLNGIQDINNVQALILYNLGDDEMTIGELTARGYYLGSNVSYNVKKMFDAGYLEQKRSPHDRRSVRVKLSEKGMDLHRGLKAYFDKQIESLSHASIDQEELKNIIGSLQKVERFWSSITNYS